MSRTRQDPVERAFEDWRALTEEQQRRLADRQWGWCEAKGIVGAPEAVRVKAPRGRAKKQSAVVASGAVHAD